MSSQAQPELGTVELLDMARGNLRKRTCSVDEEDKNKQKEHFSSEINIQFNPDDSTDKYHHIAC